MKTRRDRTKPRLDAEKGMPQLVLAQERSTSKNIKSTNEEKRKHEGDEDCSSAKRKGFTTYLNDRSSTEKKIMTTMK